MLTRLLAPLLLMLLQWLFVTSLMAEQSPRTDANGRTAMPGLLVTAEQLLRPATTAGRVLVDVRSADDYEAGHLPGAVWLNVNEWKQQALAERGLLEERHWSALVGKLGITGGTPVVVYGGNPTDATRIWWTLKYLGVQQAGVLDGGYAAWVDAGGSIERDVVEPVAVDFKPMFAPERLADLTEVQSLLKTRAAIVVDTRSAEEYAGSAGPGARKGHIPGAVHLEWTNFLTPAGRFKTAPEIRALLQQHGLTPDTQAVTHCQSGGRASVNAFVMELVGYGPVKNYYCGWSEWSTAPEAPVESTRRPDAP